MALKTITTTTTQFPLFAPPPLHHPNHHSPTEIHFSRWNNANASKHTLPKQTQKDLEIQIRFQKRFQSVQTITHNYNPAPPHPTSPNFKSPGTPSSPSSPSIPSKSSKYSHSKNPAFKPLSKPRKLPIQKPLNPNPKNPNFIINENGVSYELPEAPFVYQYSYTETPKVKPLKLREPLVSPFGPGTMAKPWMGRKPFPVSKKTNRPEFDSFVLPPVGKKGVKPVQAPGPYLPGSGPKYVRSREEVLGEELSKEEVRELVEGSKKSSRQLNMGRDGLTHNMLDNIHALWKRRRVCKIKCKGVCTVDMENVCQQLEERTGGKIIHNRGGVIYLFRGRNYNFKSRPRFPLMLWKPVAPVYPRLVKRVPEGLTLEEATGMRKKGRDLTPICKLAKNGVYCDLVKNVREAFEACELVRINCQGLNPSDYRKIGAKLKDLVPCVLISFEYEHILMWRGLEWKSSLMEPLKGLQEVKADVVDEGLLGSLSPIVEENTNNLDTSLSFSDTSEEKSEVAEDDAISEVNDVSVIASNTVSRESNDEPEIPSPVSRACDDNHAEAFGQTIENKIVLDDIAESETSKPWIEGITLLRKQAVESGMAFMLDVDSLDADTVFKNAVDFGKTAPNGPVFRHRSKKSAVEKKDEQECDDDSGPKEIPAVLGTQITVSKRRGERKTFSRNDKLMEDVKADYLNVVPQGNLGIDELAKLLM